MEAPEREREIQRHEQDARREDEHLPGVAQAEVADATDEQANPVTFAKADSALLSLAKITGGRAYFPESPNDFVTIYREIASALRHQYVLGIAPQHDGKFHALTVEIPDANRRSGPASTKSSDFQIFAREGYLASLR